MRKRRVIIEWHYPLTIQGAYARPIIWESGIYAIYSKYRDKTKLLYIGKAGNSFYERVDARDKEKVYACIGKKFVRLGIIISPKAIKAEPIEYNQLLEDIESALIWEMQPPMNISKMTNYTYRTGYYLQIHNTGRKGVFPRFIDTAKHEYDLSGIL